MTSPADNASDQENEASSASAGGDRHSEAGAGSGPRASASLPASAIPTLDGTDSIRPPVGDISARLADLAQRESNLRRREENIAEQRAAIEGALKTLRERETAEEQRRVAVRQRLADQLELIRRRKNEFIQKVQIARTELKRRKDVLAHDRKALDGQVAALREQREALERRTGDLERCSREVQTQTEELERRRTDLEARGTQLDERERSLATEETRLASRRGELDATEAELRKRGNELDARTWQLEQRAVTVEATAARFAEREQSLAGQEAEIGRRHSELDKRETESRGCEAMLDARVQQLERRIERVVAATTELDEREKTIAAREAEQAGRSAELAASEAELWNRGDELDKRAQGLEQRTEALETRQAEVDDRGRQLESQEAELRERDQQSVLHARQLDERQAALAERTTQLDDRETALEERAAAVEARCDNLVEREAEVEKRRAVVDKLYQQAAETRRGVQRKQQEVATLHERLEAREAELRRESLEVEVSREQLARDQAAVIAERQSLAESPDYADEGDPRVGARDQMPAGFAAGTSIPAAKRWRRGLVLCGVAGVAAALAWLAVERPRHRGLAELRIVSERGSPERVAGEHAEWLMSDAIAEHWRGPPPVGVWSAARVAGRVRARPLFDGGRLQLVLDTADEAIAATLPSAAVEAYVAYVRTLPLERFRDPRLTAWEQRKAALERELAGRRGRLEQIRARLAEMPGAPARGEAQAAFEKTLADFKGVVARLREQREELAVLESQEPPRGEVSVEAYQQGLGDDAVYQEDMKEFRSEARQYRAELAIAMVLLTDPLKELRESARALAATMAEQRDLQPPPNVRALLEQRLVDVDELNQVLAEFSQTWDRRRESIERLNVSAQVVELVKQQTEAADAARRLVEESRRVADELETRIERLGANGNTGTRAIVVASVLRGDLSRLTERVDTLAEAARATDPSSNFRLDAHDRQMRGLRMRLQKREQRVREMLQAEADRAADARREELRRQLRKRISESESQRQVLTDAPVADLERLRALDEQHHELGELAGEQWAEEAAISRLEERSGELETQRPQPQRDSVELLEARHEQIAGLHRWRNAGLAGGGTFGVTGLLFLLMFAQPRPRRSSVRPIAGT